MVKRWTYAKAGVDVGKLRGGQRELAEILRSTFMNREGKLGSVLTDIGHYAGLIELGGRVLALHTDGVGTKILIAELMEKFDTIGIDCIAMNVNDIICVGAEPVAFIDYLALKRHDEWLVREVAKGLVKGAEQASVAIVGGETAILPDIIKGVGDKAFDLAGMAIGVAEKVHVVTGEDVKAEDVVVGVESSGIHSNGLTLARKILLKKYGVRSYISSLGRSLGEELLEPTKIYVKPVLELLRRGVDVHGLAHITGGGFLKLSRLIEGRRLGFRLDAPPTPLPIFRLIQREGRVTDREMYRTFNMGVGLCIVTPSGEVEKVQDVFNKYGEDARVIGRVVRGRGIYVGRVRVD